MNCTSAQVGRVRANERKQNVLVEEKDKQNVPTLLTCCSAEVKSERKSGRHSSCHTGDQKRENSVVSCRLIEGHNSVCRPPQVAISLPVFVSAQNILLSQKISCSQ